MKSHGIVKMLIEVRTPLVRNNQMSLAYMICVGIFGSGQKLQPIHIPSMSIQKVIVLSDVVAVGGMRKRIAECLEDMPLIIQKRQAD